jgi:UDP-N-acetyl-D-glucosamine dehydrogenase
MIAEAFSSYDILHRKIDSRAARVGVIGLGYVGLPLAIEFARAGFHVTGIDLDARKVDAINRGESYIQDVSEHDVATLRENGRLAATTDASVIATLDTINICVPTPLRKTKDPDLSFVIAAVTAVADHLHPGMLIILESTTYPGTTDEVVKPALEAGGLVAGKDFFLAFSPERVDPGNPYYHTHNVPKVVGGLTPKCSTLAKLLYGASVETVVEVSSPKVAELVKLLENTFRAVNIGLVNELALICDRLGVSVWETIDAAATKPFGFMAFYPGPGLGGHCIPVDPYYLSWKVREVGFEARFIELAGHVNGAMPDYVVERVAHALNVHGKAVRDAKVLVLGVAYKPGVRDLRESPAIDVLATLDRRGAIVTYHDPFVPTLNATDWPGARELHSAPLTPQSLEAVDCVVIATHHRVVDYDLVARHAPLIVDTRRAIRTPMPHVFTLGAPDPAGPAFDDARPALHRFDAGVTTRS